MKRMFVIVGVALFLMTTVYAYDDGDFQIWNTENQEFKVNKESRITLEEEFRWGDDAGDFYYHHYDTGFIHSFNQNLDLQANYRQVYEKKKGEFKEESRPHLNATLKFELYAFKLDDRNRIEYQHFDYKTDTWRYRNKFAVKFPWKLTRLEIQPYVADEIFVELEDGSLSRNRLYSGLEFTIIKHIKGGVYYLLQSSKSSTQWVDAYVTGTKLKLIF